MHLKMPFADGLRLARHLLLDLAEMDVPAGTEFLNMIIPEYLAGLVSWGAISGRERPRAKCIDNWFRVCRARWDSRMARRATCRSPLRPFNRRRILTAFSALPRMDSRQSLLPLAIRCAI